jgi:hypothetical protein
MKMYLFVHKNFIGLYTLASSGYITLYFGGGGTGVSDLVMYCNDANLRIVTKSVYRTDPPYSILIICGRCWWQLAASGAGLDSGTLKTLAASRTASISMFHTGKGIRLPYKS